jgi:hypothetical protein
VLVDLQKEMKAYVKSEVDACKVSGCKPGVNFRPVK